MVGKKCIFSVHWVVFYHYILLLRC